MNARRSMMRKYDLDVRLCYDKLHLELESSSDNVVGSVDCAFSVLAAAVLLLWRGYRSRTAIRTARQFCVS